MGTTSAQLARCGELERLLALERSEHQRLKAQVAEAQSAPRAAGPESARTTGGTEALTDMPQGFVGSSGELA